MVWTLFFLSKSNGAPFFTGLNFPASQNQQNNKKKSFNWEYWEVDDFSVLSDSWVAEFSAHLRKNVRLEKYALFQQDFLVAAV